MHVPDSSYETGSEGVLSWLDRERITVLHTVPSIVQSWLADSRPGARLPSLRWALFAGEPLTDSLVRRWRSAFPAAGSIVNLYGPTETTLAKCFFIVPEEPRPGDPARRRSAAADTGARAPRRMGEVRNRRNGRDRSSHAVRQPAGTSMLRASNRSASCEIPSDGTEQRRTPTSFIVRAIVADMRMDGSLHIHGRLDDQVKVRGIRIEPAEIASVLSSHPQVSSCAVVAGLGESGETELAAYVVRASSSQTRDISTELRRHVLARLPAVMIPSTFTFLERLPLTANGKLDRAALPQPAKRVPGAEGSSAVSSSRERRKPTADEQTLIDVWGALLGVENIGPDDDFYALGGHSLNAAQAMSKARAAFGVDLPVRMIFEHPTISALAAAIQRRRQSAAALRRIPRGAQEPAGRAGTGTGTGASQAHIDPAAGGSCRAGAALLRPAAPLGPRPARPGEVHLQRAPRFPAPWRSRRPGARQGFRGDPGPPRGPPNGIRHEGWRARRDSRRQAAVAAASRRPRLAGGSGPRVGGAADPGGGRGGSLRPRARSLSARHAPSTR